MTRVNLNDCGATYEATEVIVPIADARALWAVRVLDAWADARDGRGQWQLQKLTGFNVTTYSVLCTGRDALDLQHEHATSADAARLAAALAVLPGLPTDVRAKLGECP